MPDEVAQTRLLLVACSGNKPQALDHTGVALADRLTIIPAACGYGGERTNSPVRNPLYGADIASHAPASRAHALGWKRRPFRTEDRSLRPSPEEGRASYCWRRWFIPQGRSLQKGLPIDRARRSPLRSVFLCRPARPSPTGQIATPSPHRWVAIAIVTPEALPVA